MQKTSRKALIFTIDALFSLALFAVVAMSFSAFFQQTPHLQRLSLLQSLGRDYLVVNSQGVSLSENDFQTLTGLKITTSAAGPPDTSSFAVRATLFSYPLQCGCDHTAQCILTLADANLCFSGASSQEPARRFFKNESWVYLP